jgi:hypothetical protein
MSSRNFLIKCIDDEHHKLINFSLKFHGFCLLQHFNHILSDWTFIYIEFIQIIFIFCF